MGWAPVTRPGITVIEEFLVVRAQVGGAVSLTKQGHLRLPAPVRHWCGLVPGDRVLLAADPAGGCLIVHPPAALDRMIALSGSRTRLSVLTCGFRLLVRTR
jgi:bifunctional DNA-binding transcriptional regulator/antitoxin component of YhaV-PrlF toxin-antitoxin module